METGEGARVLMVGKRRCTAHRKWFTLGREERFFLGDIRNWDERPVVEITGG